jgi:hypothetical protein
MTLSRKNTIAIIARIAWIGIGGLILVLPWFVHIYGGGIIKLFTYQISTLPAKISASAELINTIGDITFYLPIVIWILFLLSIAWSLWKRNKHILIFTLWWIFILIATNPSWIGLPGNGVITNFAVFIAFYIPASVVIGSTFAFILFTRLQPVEIEDHSNGSILSQYILPILIFLVIIVIGSWGTSKRINEVNLSAYELVTRPDLRAMEWIKDNTAESDDFLVNSFFAYSDTLVVGSDGGWWIPMLTGRKTTLPPLTYGIEEGGKVTDINSTNDLYREIQNKGITDPDVISMLKQHGINYIYSGQRQGSVNNPGPKIIDPQVLAGNPNFKVKYNQDRVWIFELLQ